MNDEVKLILTKLKIVSEEKENGAYICDKEHSKLLLSYIEQLEKQSELAEHYKHLYSEVKKQKDEIKKYIKSFEYYIPKEHKTELLRMLGEIDVED